MNAKDYQRIVAEAQAVEKAINRPQEIVDQIAHLKHMVSPTSGKFRYVNLEICEEAISNRHIQIRCNGDAERKFFENLYAALLDYNADILDELAAMPPPDLVAAIREVRP